MGEDRITRRTLLARCGQGALVAGASWLAACGIGGTSNPSGATGDTPAAGSEGRPVRGGTLTVGVMTGGSAETLEPGLINQWPDSTRGPMLYNQLFTVKEDLTLLPGLAVSAESNNKADVWTLKLRDGVTWHDGKPFGADDVVAAFQGWSETSNFNYGTLDGIVDFTRVRKRGNLDVEVSLLRPVVQFPTLLTIWTAQVPQAGSTPASFQTHPIGTGPFTFESFTPGKRSVFVRNPDYWEDGKPYVDRIIVDSSFTDESARLNALLSGQINALELIPFQTAKRQGDNGTMKILRSQGGQNYTITFRIDLAPFEDVRVRRAMKLIFDRQQIVDNALAGFARPANDVVGAPGIPYFDDSLKAQHDPEKAKALLKAAGHEGLAFTLPVAPAAPGFVEAATLFAEQAKAAGVKITLENIPTANYWSPTPGNYTYRQIQLDATPGYPSLDAYYRAYLTTGAPAGASHWGSNEHDQEIYDAMAETDPARAKERWAAVQRDQFDNGGIVVYADTDWVDAVAPNVNGLRAGRAFPFNNFRWQDGWINSR